MKHLRLIFFAIFAVNFSALALPATSGMAPNSNQARSSGLSSSSFAQSQAIQAARMSLAQGISSSSNQSSSSATIAPISIRERFKDSLITVSFRKTRIQDLLRTLNSSYGVNVVLQQGIEAVVDFHLDKVPMVEALEALCRSQSWELTDNGEVFQIQKPTIKSKELIEGSQQKMDLDVQNQEVKLFIKNFAEKTGLKILASPELKGNVTGSWKNQPAMDAFRALIDAHGYAMRFKNDFLIVEQGDGPPTPNNNNSMNGNRGMAGGKTIQVNYYQGKLSLNLDNADLSDVLKSISKEVGINVIFYGDVRENVSARLEKVSVEEALSAIMKGSHFTYTRTIDSTLIVGSKDPKTESGKILTTYELYKLKYVKAEDVPKLLPAFIPSTALTVDKEQNAVIITGTTVEIQGVKKYLDLLDQSAPQVLLECIIMELSRGNNSQMGLQTGGNPQSANAYGNGPQLPFQFNATGMTWIQGYQGAYTSFGILPQNFTAQLSALESENKAKVLAMPKVTTVNGNKSEIKVANTSYYQVSTVSKDGFPVVDYKPIESGITMEITPYITSGGEITIDIKPEIKTASATSSANRPADISSRSLQTTIKLRDGQTAMLGGLIQNNHTKIREGVPILGSIPLLGYLFSYYTDVDQTTELVVFVTPHVMPADSLAVDPVKIVKEVENRKESSDYGDKIRDFGKAQ